MPGQEAEVEVLRAVTVGVGHLRLGPDARERLDPRHHAGLLLDLAQQACRRLLPRLEDPADQAPLAVVGATPEQHVPACVAHDGRDAGHPQEVVTQPFAQVEDEVRRRHGPTLTTGDVATAALLASVPQRFRPSPQST